MKSDVFAEIAGFVECWRSFDRAGFSDVWNEDFSAVGPLQIVRNQFVGVYSMCTAKDPYNTNSLEIAADLFIAKYGKQCTMYAMMMYFGNYITEYKSSFAQFDMQDILQQFGKKFLPWWNSQQEDPSQYKEQNQLESGLTGRYALVQLLASRLQNGETLDDLRNSNLFKLGFCKEEDLAEIQKIAMETF